MVKILVGSTGFVGQNIAATTVFDGLYHSTDVEKAYGMRPDLLVYAGVKAAKFLANQNAEADWEEVKKATENIRCIAPKKLVLISTIDVWKNPQGVDEDAEVKTEGLHPYGFNRYRLEQDVRNIVPECLVIRLPALYGQGLKKNFIYDMMTLVPSMLPEEKYRELAISSDVVRDSYVRQENGFWRCLYCLSDIEFQGLKEEFRRLGFTSMAFTDSRATYQFYNLAHLWNHMLLALKHDLKLLHLATEPVSSAEIFEYVFGRRFVNELSKQVAHYDFRTKYADILGGEDGYVEKKDCVLRSIRLFVSSNSYLGEFK